MNKSEFDLKYGKSSLLGRSEVSDILFFWILGASITITVLTIVILANLQFENLNEQIKQNYQEFALSLVPEPVVQKPSLQKNKFSTSQERATEDSSLTENISEVEKNLPTINIGDIQIEELSHDGSGDRTDGLTVRPVTRTQRGQVKLKLDGLMDNPLEYQIERNAQLYIEEPVGQSANEEKFGYRDQDEVYRVLDTKSINIEACYEKAARFGMVDGGYVKVEFKINSDGFILPQSIKIIDSNLRNKTVEQCIKKNIRRLRGFEKLDESRGIARVTHKFIFN